MIDHKVQTGIAYVISTPIGNKQDIGLRALELLKSNKIIACEDTRICNELLKGLDIHDSKKLISYYDQNEKTRVTEVIGYLLKGENVILVSDAGTPNISDPGYHLLNKCYENDIRVIGIPGASSVTCALSICPIGGSSFYFSGFAPEKQNERINTFASLRSVADRVVFFEAPHRLLDHLHDSINYFTGKIFIARELTKKFEETYYDTIENLIEHFMTKKPLGEFVIIYPRQEEIFSLEELKTEIKTYLNSNLKPTDILQKVQKLTNLKRRELYDLITEIKHHLKKD